MQALQEFERTGNVDDLVQRFSDDCQVSNVASIHEFKGRDGARQFWREYKGLLGNVRSRLRSAIESSDRAALEWQSEGTASTGAPISYEGVTILEFDDEGRVRRFYAYFDPHKLGMALRPVPAEQRAPA